MVCSSSLETRKSLTLTTPGTQCAPPPVSPTERLKKIRSHLSQISFCYSAKLYDVSIIIVRFDCHQEVSYFTSVLF